MRVLLLSPLATLDPANGDVTYTERLLADPPPGVDYVTYDTALRDGTLVELGRPANWSSGLASAAWSAQRLLINGLRRAEVLFREPFRSFYVAPDVYDLVHAHVFSV